jgi:GT2 family glycosyltransferase
VAEEQIELSVIIAATHGPTALAQCLLSLEPQAGAEDTEVIVASNFDYKVTPDVSKGFSALSIVVSPQGTTVPELRTSGIKHARGNIVALTEDHCVFDANWCSEIKRAHTQPYAVIGGSVENRADAGSLDWAVYLYEYGRYMSPNPEGVSDALPGNNISYKRSILQTVEPKYRDGFFETFINWELQSRGHFLFLMPSAVVIHRQKYEPRAAVAQSYYHGRLFAGKRVTERSLAKRVPMILGSVLLPLLLPSRIFLRAIQKKRKQRQIIEAMPCLFLLMSAWSLGELVGYLMGEGESASRWK